MNSTFDNTKPIYLQIVEKIESEIISGARSPGERIESVRELALKLKVNPNTIQRALSELESEKLVETERTNGRYVTNNESRIKKLRQTTYLKKTKEYLNEMKKIGIEIIEIRRKDEN